MVDVEAERGGEAASQCAKADGYKGEAHHPFVADPVAHGLAGKGTLDAQIRSETQRVDASRNAYALAEQRFKAGEDDNLALLEAQRTLYGSQQALVRSKLVRLSNLINLYKALGGGWTEFAAPPDDPLTR